MASAKKSSSSLFTYTPESWPALKVDHQTIAKEIARYRPCDSESRCFYCRDWAQLVYKKQFTWNAQTQEEALAKLAEAEQAAQVHKSIRADTRAFCSELQDHVQKEFADRNKSNGHGAATEGNDSDSIIKRLIDATLNHVKTPTVDNPLDGLFAPILYEPCLIEDMDYEETKGEPLPGLLLEDVIIDRQSVSLPPEGFQALSNITKEVLYAQVKPNCGHMKPTDLSPSDLDTEKAIFEAEVATHKERLTAALSKASDTAWVHLQLFLNRLAKMEDDRQLLMGEGILNALNDYARVEETSIVPFADYWPPKAEEFKKTSKTGKRGKGSFEATIATSEQVVLVDSAFFEYLKIILQSTTDFRSNFVEPRLDKVQDFINSHVQTMCDYLSSTIARMAKAWRPDRWSDVPKIHEDCSKKTEEFNDMLQKHFNLREQSIAKALEVCSLTEEIKNAWDDSSKTVQGRLDKAAQKEFRKKIKKLEYCASQYRQWFISELKDRSAFFGRFLGEFIVNCIEVLLLEGEVDEENRFAEFDKTHNEIISRFDHMREDIEYRFEEGVLVGRHQFGGIMGKLFMKEGIRLQEANIALKKQNQLLKQFGATAIASSEGDKKRKQLLPGAKGLQSTSPSAPSPTTESGTESGTATPTRLVELTNEKEVEKSDSADAISSSKKKKKNKKKKAAATDSSSSAIAQPVDLPIAEELAGDIPTEPVAEVSETLEQVDLNDSPVIQEKEVASKSPLEPANEDDTTTTDQPAASPRMPPLVVEDTMPAPATQKSANPPAPEAERDAAVENPPTNDTSTIQTSAAEPPGTVIEYEDTKADIEDNADSVGDTTTSNTSTALNLDTLPHADLVNIVRSLHSENSQLVSTLRNIQSEMTTMKNQYTELVEMARQREYQTISMMEARKNAEMDEIRRYVKILEQKIVQLEQEKDCSTPSLGSMNSFTPPGLTGNHSPLKSDRPNPWGPPTTFNTSNRSYSPPHRQSPTNQSVTALSMSDVWSFNPNDTQSVPADSQRGQVQSDRFGRGGQYKVFGPPQSGNIWRPTGKKATTVRCGNCGEMGHESASCVQSCRYCGSRQHLSQSCPVV
ncbi:hypothetical protein BZG36_00288 [Bifiguratus adelaidae]|uniref:CCHC-type domain-containing protein n=1 Tax=Bifiguratus adelaidae TaxID=1938954 RepID=A0A261Y7Z5_9FUNG|nr:hypothetical protein BZG36_00288 [Bifiguratus adelaidae]